ncbi:PRC-barrel domain-containing protein [Geminicoccus roseus]|uniref:PRC-barrel domain-containing protein n=1 Tax=Geminicoccus roseus TaxID=404900 RepID=UPI0004240F24|nr:PRC-barrel domain-containing protein [Geminicoccus roseus]
MSATSSDLQGSVEANETSTLIASDKVEGTEVYNRAGDHLGTIHNLMIDKTSGQVAYAVLSFGGFLGIGSTYHPLPWRALTYDRISGGYVIDIDKNRLEGAPSYSADQDQGHWMDRDYGRRIDEFYGY